jgi:hypothetical protein
MVQGFESEWGCFVLSQLESFRGPLGPGARAGSVRRAGPSEIIRVFLSKHPFFGALRSRGEHRGMTAGHLTHTTHREQPEGVFPQPEDGKAKVWRYLSLAKLLYVLDRRALVMTRLDLQRDSHEGAPTHPTRVILEKALRKQTDNQELIRMFRDHPRHLRERFYVNSWCLNDSDSEAMWRLYCPNDEGVALQTTYAKLDASLPVLDAGRALYLGKVTYVDYAQDVQPAGNAFYRVMFKRRSFEYEHEVRIVMWDLRGKAAERPKVFELPWDALAALESIVVNPYASQWYFEVVKAALGRFTPKLARRLKWSRMRADPWAGG